MEKKEWLKNMYANLCNTFVTVITNNNILLQ